MENIRQPLCLLLSVLCRHLTLSQSDMAALTGGKGFPFLFQHIRDGINIRQTCNLIFSLCRYNNRLAEHVRAATCTLARIPPAEVLIFFIYLSQEDKIRRCSESVAIFFYY